MEAVAHNPAFAKKAGVPQSVGKEFSNADKGKTFKRGGDMATKKMDPKMMAMMAAKKRGAGKSAMAPARPAMPPAGGMGGGMGMMKKGGMTKMAAGGMPMKDGKPAFIGDGKGAMKHGGMAKKMASGGLAAGHKSADGVAKQGKTMGTMIKMKSGGKTC
jgi:hypothetical protein